MCRYVWPSGAPFVGAFDRTINNPLIEILNSPSNEMYCVTVQNDVHSLTRFSAHILNLSCVQLVGVCDITASLEANHVTMQLKHVMWKLGV